VKTLAPTLPIGWVKAGALHLRQGKKALGLADYEKAYRLNEDSWLLANDLAFLIAENSRAPKDLDRAIAMAEKARASNPEALNVVDTLGWLHYKKGDADKAVELLRQVQSKRPDAPESNFHLGMALYQAGKLPEAKEKLSKSLAAKENFPGRDEATRTLAKI
jgi:tetratricopeptide (TPR) repeat protein